MSDAVTAAALERERRVWKYDLDPWSQRYKMPKGAILRHVAVQNGKPRVWVEVDPNAPSVDHLISVDATGNPIKHDGEYVGTFHVEEDGLILVFHVYDCGEA